MHVAPLALALLMVASEGGGHALFVSVAFPVEVALDRRRPQQLLDAFRLVESLVDAKADFRGELQVDAAGELAANEFLVAVERVEHPALVPAADPPPLN